MPRLRTIALPSMTCAAIPWPAVQDLLVTRASIGQPVRKLLVPTNEVDKVAAIFPAAEGIVQVEEWNRVLVRGWPAWSDLP